MHMKKRVYTKWCWWWFFNTIFCIHKISSQCYKMKLYQFRWSYHFHLRLRLTLRDIHRWFAACLSFANQRQEFIHESTPAETQAVLIRNRTNLKKHRRKRREQKNSTPFLKWSFRGHKHHLTKAQKSGPVFWLRPIHFLIFLAFNCRLFSRLDQFFQGLATEDHRPTINHRGGNGHDLPFLTNLREVLQIDHGCRYLWV